MKINKVVLTSESIFSLIYHQLFSYPLTSLELIKWQPGKKAKSYKIGKIDYGYLDGYYYLKKNTNFVYSRLLRKNISLKKIILAKKAAKFLSIIPSIKMIAVTGSLSMLNAKGDSDIDLMIVTKKGKLWSTRFLSLFSLMALGFKVRRFKEKEETNKLCINIWLDESNLSWPPSDRNFYTAHEIAQIIPILDKDNTYQNLLNRNIWIKDYWPSAVKIKKLKRIKYPKLSLLEKSFELFLFKIQKMYMKNKRTREVVTKKRAIFHPIDRSRDTLTKLDQYLI
jgi:D-beta-D-heptose 7-phosphate kinase/D-beta-D-heptose 1-phosphate adenosyltransferase